MKAHHTGYRILHIDDNKDFLEIFRFTFENFFKITSIQDSSKGIQILAKERFDAIVLDYDMPDTNGLEVLKLLRKEFPDIPVVFYTGQGNENIAREAFVHGASDYFVKTVREIFQNEKITNSILKAIHRSRIEIELRENRKKLEESNEKLREILDNMSSGVAVYEAVNEGQDFIFKDFNSSAEKIEKITKDKLVGKSVRNIFPSIIEFGLFEVFHRVWKSGKPEIYPAAFYKDNRIQGWRENYVYKLSTGEVVAIYDDVTRRIKAENYILHLNKILRANRNIDKLLLDEKDLEKLIQEICDTLVGSGAYASAWMVLLDEKYNYSFSWESRPHKKFDYLVEKLKDGESFPGILELINKCDLISLQDNSHIDSDSVAIFIEEYTNEPAMLRMLEYSERIFGFIYVSLFIDFKINEEEKALFSDLAHDISHGLYNLEVEKKHQQALVELMESEKKYRNLIEMANDAILILDAESGIILFANQKAIDLIGLSRKEIIGKSHLDLHPRGELSRFREIFKHITNRETSIFKSKFYSHKYNKVLDMEVSTNVVKVGSKKIIQGIFRDLSERESKIPDFIDTREIPLKPTVL